MFAFFESLVRPTTLPQAAPPRGLMAFYWHFIRQTRGLYAAIIGGLASYPIAALGALLVGLLESFSSFWASAYKEVIVFTLIIPVLLWRSLSFAGSEEEEAEE